MEITEDDLFDIVQSVWTTVVDIELDKVAPGDVPEIDDELICAWMELSGGWEGGILLTCQESLAMHAAAVMYEVDPDMLGEDAMHDTVGELANMIAGSTKPMLPDDAQMGQPQIVEESELPPACMSSWPMAYVAAMTNGMVAYVSLFKWV